MGLYDQYVPEAGTGKYLKPDDGKSYSLKVVSEPVIFDNVFEAPGKPTTVQTKYAWVVWNYTLGMAQIWQLPVTGYRAIASIASNPKWGDPLDGKFDIDYKRTGLGLETEHSVVPVPAEGDLTEEQLKEIADIKLLDAIKAGKGAQRVQWLADVAAAGNQRAKASVEHEDDVIADIGDEPINLDDIPF